MALEEFDLGELSLMPSAFKDRSELLKAFDKNLKAGAGILEAAGNEILFAKWKLKRNGIVSLRGYEASGLRTIRYLLRHDKHGLSFRVYEESSLNIIRYLLRRHDKHGLSFRGYEESSLNIIRYLLRRHDKHGLSFRGTRNPA